MPVPGKTWLCPHTILPAQSRRACRVEAEGKQPHTVPLWEHPAQRDAHTLCQKQAEELPDQGFPTFATRPESWGR